MDELDKKLLEGEDDIKNGRIYSAREVFEELEEEYDNKKLYKGNIKKP